MADKSAIEWTDATWNPIVGCSVLTPGCTNCYAMKMAARIERMHAGRTHYAGTTKTVNGNAVWTGKMVLAPENILLQPLKWKRGRRIFVNSMGDLFHESIPDEWIDRVFAIMALSPQHTFQVLTKRAERMRQYWKSIVDRWDAISNAVHEIQPIDAPDFYGFETFLSNVWLGVSTERQKEADERIPLLLQTPAAVRFISAEPLLGPINLTAVPRVDKPCRDALLVGAYRVDRLFVEYPRLDWVIVGGESGHNARPFSLEWAVTIIDQCASAGVPCFVKQVGSYPTSEGYRVGLRGSKGGELDKWPSNLRVREFPAAAKVQAA